MRTGQAVQGSLAESLIDWDKGLLMRQIAHQAGTTCFSDVTLFQTSPGAHRPKHGHPIYVCVCAFMCVFLSLVITLKTNWNWLALRPSGSPWTHPGMSSVAVRTESSKLNVTANMHIKLNLTQLAILANNILHLGWNNSLNENRKQENELDSYTIYSIKKSCPLCLSPHLFLY